MTTQRLFRPTRLGPLLIGLAAMAGCTTSPHTTAQAQVPPSAATGQPRASVPDPAFESSGDARFDAWRIDFFKRAVASGRSANVMTSLLTGLSPLERVKELNAFQSEFTKPIWSYIDGAVTPGRIETGITRLDLDPEFFDKLEQTHGVPRQIIVAIWGMETSYGRVLGTFDAPAALATLAYEGRRTELGETELLALADLISRGQVRRDALVSSWAGAMGQTQFMPSSILTYGTDWEGDGLLELWSNPRDALGSAANYLARNGWRTGEPAIAEVRLGQGFNYGLANGDRRTVRDWIGRGVSVPEGIPPDLDAALFLPAGAAGPAFLTFANYRVIKRYNFADSYALSVVFLADAYRGISSPVAPWPREQDVLQPEDVKLLQMALTRLGFDPGGVDGVAGRGTRAALQRWQSARGLAADGFPTKAMLERLKSEAGI
jgi:membrane-bound lytic murein transglycosylase B